DTTRSLLARSLERLRGVNVKLIGTILNNVVVSRVGRYYSSYYHVGYSRYARDYQSTYYAQDVHDTQDMVARVNAVTQKLADPSPEPAIDNDEPITLTAVPEAPAESPPERKQRQQSIVQSAVDACRAGHLTDAKKALAAIVQDAAVENSAWELYLGILLEENDQLTLVHVADQLANDQNAGRHLHALARGHLALMQGDTDLARSFYDESRGLAPQNGAVLEATLRLSVQRQDNEAARGYLTQLLTIQPDNAYAHFVAAYFHVLEDDAAAAEQSLRKSIGLRKSADALHDLAYLLAGRNAYAEAEQAVRSALTLNDTSDSLWYLLGTVLALTNRHAEALKALEAAHDLNADNTSVQLALIETHHRLGNTEQARRWIQPLSQNLTNLEPEDRDRLSELGRLVANG
ncbi:MAG: tetratricopeptide repeat protein, partial [Verrucomicrobia bacterium]|nr:tetratricopeptide repeat protein [Verrucomicrobiota bacterium]